MNAILLITALFLSIVIRGDAQETTEAWRAAAMKKYPQLAVPGSPFNKAFVDAYNQRKQNSPASLQDPRWPMVIAEEVDASLPAALKNPPPASQGAPVAGTPGKPAKEDGPPKLTFRNSWAAKTALSAGGGSGTREDLKKLLSRHGKASPEIKDLGPVEIFHGVTYLMPLKEALAKLGLEKQLGPKSKVACAGFPDGLYFTAFDGRFEGHYNRLFVISDSLDQVAGIHMVDESPETGIQHGYEDNWRTYNFVNARVKSKAYLEIKHHAAKSGPLIHIRSELFDPQKGKHVEVSHSIIPQPIVNAILHCVE